MPKYLTNLLKLLITVVGVYLVLQNVTVADIVETLTEVNWFWVVLAVGLMTARLVLRAYRWRLLLVGVGSHIAFGRLITIYFIGNFFNAFLPSGFGGDVVQVVEAARDVPTDIAAGTVLVDRLTGLITLFVMGLIGLPFRPDGFPAAQTWLVLILSVAGLIGGYLLLDGRLIQRYGRWLTGKLSPVGDGPLAKLLKAIQACGWRAVWGAMGVSVGVSGYGRLRARIGSGARFGSGRFAHVGFEFLEAFSPHAWAPAAKPKARAIRRAIWRVMGISW